MTTYRTGVTGPFPRTEELVQATRDLDRGRITPEAGAAAFGRAEAEVVAVEERLGLDARTGGYLRWADLLRPFTEIWPGVAAGPLTRFFETNTFYRQPVLARPPSGGSGKLAGWLPRGPTARAILPGPYTFRKLADVSYATDTSNAPVVEIAAAMAAELRALGAGAPRQVQFQEPMLVYDPPRGEGAEIVEAYRLLADALPRTTKLLWTFFGDVGPALPLLGRLPVDVIGFDLFESNLDRAPTLPRHGIGVGVIDPRSTLAEQPAEVARLVRSAEKTLGASDVWLGPSPPFDLLPFTAAVEKLALLPTLRQELAR
jgi:5-methyltetrahydropteroyltriglutamate--homocysteine methyltransferase